MMSIQKSNSTFSGLNNSLKHPSFIATQINENMEVNNQCRICLQNQQQSFPRTLIKPCRCSGSVSYVHQECIKKWLEATLSKKTFRERLIAFERGVACEMCKSMIKFEVIIEKSFNNCADIRRLIGMKIVLFLMLIFLIVASSIGTVFSLYYIAFNSQTLQQKGINLMILILSICGALFSILFFGVATFLLVQQFLIKQRTQIHRIKSFSTIATRQSYAKNKIVPMDNDEQNQTMQMISMVQ